MFAGGERAGEELQGFGIEAVEGGSNGKSKGFFGIEVNDGFFAGGLKGFDHGIEGGIVFGCKRFFYFSVLHPRTAILGDQNRFMDVRPPVSGIRDEGSRGRKQKVRVE